MSFSQPVSRMRCAMPPEAPKKQNKVPPLLPGGEELMHCLGVDTVATPQGKGAQRGRTTAVRSSVPSSSASALAVGAFPPPGCVEEVDQPPQTACAVKRELVPLEAPGRKRMMIKREPGARAPETTSDESQPQETPDDEDDDTAVDLAAYAPADSRKRCQWCGVYGKKALPPEVRC